MAQDVIKLAYKQTYHSFAGINRDKLKRRYEGLWYTEIVGNLRKGNVFLMNSPDKFFLICIEQSKKKKVAILP